MANQADLDRTMVALADPTRRAILRRLAQGEARHRTRPPLCHVAQLGIQAYPHAGERPSGAPAAQGREHLLSFNPEPLDEAAAWLSPARVLDCTARCARAGAEEAANLTRMGRDDR